MKIDIKKIACMLLFATVCISNAAFAQWVPGQLVTAQLLNSAFAAVAANALPVAGGTLTGPLQGTAATFNSGSFASLSSSGPVTFSTPLAFASGGTGEHLAAHSAVFMKPSISKRDGSDGLVEQRQNLLRAACRSLGCGPHQVARRAGAHGQEGDAGSMILEIFQNGRFRRRGRQ
ncbi:hypothetical protein [Burkholderia glumae]|uniref:hypothetical protein n=1 Tax=Burkholderia glumae TaxID=337 RepID=UPI00265DAFD3|nr:hypothetical protein [Burkholderia glumae]